MIFVDNFLNQITMYRLTFWCLIFLWVASLALSLLGILPYQPVDLAFCALLIFLFCYFSNQLLAYLFRAPSNVESVYITVFILALIISPAKPLSHFLFLAVASVGAMASKYLLAIRKKHIFNPAAFGVVAAAMVTGQYASWWIGNVWMAPLVAVVGFLIARKLQRWDLVLSFFAVSLALILGYSIWHGQQMAIIVKELVFDSPWMFFAFVMLTEPATTPPKKNLRIVYGALAGVLFAPFINILGVSFSPELALLACNIVSYIASPKQKLVLTLQEKRPIANRTFEFVFTPKKPLRFTPGQYLEWTLGHGSQDNRGMRRYFTIASSPTENQVRIGVKFYQKHSSYKKALQDLAPGQHIVAGQLAGDFTLPADKTKKLVFLAGGIGITPFRSMVKYLLDKNEKRDIIIFYANTTFSDIAYREVFAAAQEKLGIPTVHVLLDAAGLPADFPCRSGMIDKKMILKNVPDYQERMFYISGPKAMIDSFKASLKEMGVHQSHIKTDFFPGFA